MWLGTRAGEARRFLYGAASLCAFLLGASQLRAQGTPAGSVIRNWATLAYTSSGFGYVVPSDTVDLVVGQVAGVNLQPSQSGNGSPGASVVFAHTVTNLGNGTDSIGITATSRQGWALTLYRDVNANGVLDAGDVVLTSALQLTSGSTAALLVSVAVPGSGSAGITDTITVTATSRFDPSVSSSARDVLTVTAAPVVFNFTKQVDRATAAPGDVLTYTLSYTASGTGPAAGVQLADTVPTGSSYVAGSIRWNGIAQSDPVDGDAGALIATGNGVVIVTLGAIAPGAAGSVTLQARVNAAAISPVSNRGNITYAWSGGADTTLSNTVQTTLLAPALSLSKQLTSPVIVLVGQPVQYRLHYGNANGAGTAQNVVLTDTLPQGLQYVSATAAPAVSGQVLTWALGTLAPGDSGTIDLVLAIAATVRDTVRVVNTAYIQGQATPVLSASAAQVALVGPPTAALGLDLTADVLEISVGEAIPYTVTVRNPGTLDVTNLQIAVQLPVGARYVPASSIGADSSVVRAGRLIIYSAAPLPPGASRTLRYVAALLSAPGTVAEARAIATGQVTGGLAGSPEAIAWVQIRRAWPMETRVAIGKVWVDANHDGVQQADEPGVANVDVWTEDGLVATTDSTGKFSFTNVRPGRHAFRLDPFSIPDGFHLASDDIQLVEASGWTTPQIDFRLLPGGGGNAAGVVAPPPLVAHPSQTRDRRAANETTPVQLSEGNAEFSFAAVRLPEPARGDSFAFLHPLPIEQRAKVRFEISVQQWQGIAFDAMVSMSPRPDSAIVYVDGAKFSTYGWINRAIPIPFAHPGALIRIVAWSSQLRDSAALRIFAWPPHAGQNDTQERFVGRTVAQVGASVQKSAAPVVASVTLPAIKGAQPVVAARHSSSATDSIAATTHNAPVPPVPPVPPAPETVFVAHARAPNHQAAEQAFSLVHGPGIEIFAPVDGAILAADRVYVGVKAEPNVAIVLYDGATAIDSARTRIDGVFDFIAVPVARGPHHLRVCVKNSWNQERWDSIAVHVSGLPARFEIAEGAMTMVADGRSLAQLPVRVVDSWGVPVAQPAYVTVSAKGAEPQGADADGSSVGLQLLSTTAGQLVVELRSGRIVGPGQLTLKSGDATATVPLELLPEVRGLTVAGSGLIGAGATPDAYGALTARGRIDAHTSFTVGLDSRRLNDGRNAFARSADPLEESQYPILGDASAQQTRTVSQTWLSARVEHGYDWASFGDLSTMDFASGVSLTQYRRSVTGVATHLTAGALTWSAFGSLTSQALQQLQIRGAGISGPYQLAGQIVPGTEYIRVETRDRANPERAVATQGLVRFVDYQIDYESGLVLFKQPIPATDADGNPVFITVTFEAASGAVQRLVAGTRAALDVRHLAGNRLRLDSMRIGVTAINAEQAINRYRLIGGDVRLFRLGALDIGGEVAYAELGDSTGIATSAKASYSLFNGAFTMAGGYMRVGREFTNPSNVALQPGLTEANLRAGLKFGSMELRAEHTREEFAMQGIDRQHTRVGVVRHVGSDLQLDGGVASDHVSGTSLTASDVTAADLRARWTPMPRLQIWTEARRHLSLSGPELSPELVGAGANFRVAPTLSLEASERFVSRPDSQKQYSVSSVGLRADIGRGTQAWGSYQLTGGISGAGNAAIVGLRNRLQLTPSFALNVLFERRQGVSRASIADPVRALPFLQTEGDYWSAGAGVEFLPKNAPYRLTARGEYKDGALQSTRLATVSGDMAFAASLALLTRQEFSQNALPGAPLARRLSSLWGLAFRPARTDRVNMLAKFQWSDDRNPLGGAALVARGEERKLIGAAELIWTPYHALEVSTRYAVRRTQSDRVYSDGTPQLLTAWADYVGGRVTVEVNRWVSLRSDGRLLVERTTGAQAWDGAPSLVLRPIPAIEIATGYRFGDLSDPDFAVRGGHGAFITLSAAITEKLFPTAAAFWRPRF